MWNRVSTSKYLEDYENIERFRKLHNALCSAKSILKTGSPLKPTFLKDRKKQQAIRRQEMDKVFYENKILLQKMDDIQKRHIYKPSLYQGKKNMFKVSENRYPIAEGIMNRKHKMAEQRRVDEENKDLYRRITKVKPHYPKEKLIGEAQENEKYRCSISRNARRVQHQPSDERLVFLYQNRPVSRAETVKPARIMTGRPLSLSASSHQLPRPRTTLGRLGASVSAQNDRASTDNGARKMLGSEDVF